MAVGLITAAVLAVVVGVVAFLAEPPIAPALFAFAAGAGLAAVGALVGHDRAGFVIAGASIAFVAVLAFAFTIGLMNTR